MLHNCMLGGKRKKATKLLTNVPALRKLSHDVCTEANGVCDRTGEKHLSWDPDVAAQGGQIECKTEAEAEYPPAMCEKIAGLLGEELS